MQRVIYKLRHIKQEFSALSIERCAKIIILVAVNISFSSLASLGRYASIKGTAWKMLQNFCKRGPARQLQTRLR